MAVVNPYREDVYKYNNECNLYVNEDTFCTKFFTVCIVLKKTTSSRYGALVWACSCATQCT